MHELNKVAKERCLHDIDQAYDLVVIGAGIYGAWSALHAQNLGLKVLLIDKGDIANQTSSCSTKLIHGGLRYLENYEFGLVRKSLNERKKLSQMVPHLFKSINFIIPIYNKKPAPVWKIKIGLWLYDHLSFGKQPVDVSSQWNEQKIAHILPYLKNKNPEGVLSYGDGITDDHRLTLNVVLKFVRQGGHFLPYCKADAQKNISDQALDLKIDLCDEAGIKKSIMTQHAVHCSGTSLADPKIQREQLHITKGVHLVMPTLGLKEALLLNSPLDGRVFFITPWYNRTLIGTTDTTDRYQVKPTVTNDDIHYLLSSANAFLAESYSRDQVISAFSGHRVLVGSSDFSPSQQSRGWKSSKIDSKQTCSLGGKLTSARVDALEMIKGIFPSQKKSSHTNILNTNLNQYQDTKLESHPIICDNTKEHLYHRYGHQLKAIINICEEESALSQKIISDAYFIWAEIIFCIKYEMVIHLTDLLRRRIPLFLITKYDQSLLDQILKHASTILHWNEERSQMELDEAKKNWLEFNLALDS